MIASNTIFEDGKYERVHVPLPEKEADRAHYYARLREINESVNMLISAYDDFIKTCSMDGLDIYGAEPSLSGSS
jgi:hypothetical protein